MSTKSSTFLTIPCHGTNEESDMDEFEDMDKVIEESPNGRWSKLATEIYAQRLIDFDCSNLAIDTDKGCEVAWNEMKFVKDSAYNRFDSVQTLVSIHERLCYILKFLIKLDHSNILKFYDYWFVNNQKEAKLVVVSEYTAAGSLKKVLDSSKSSKTQIKPHTYKRWLNQILYTIRYLHENNISIFQGHLNSETIFIHNSGVIKLAPTLLLLLSNDICEFSQTSIRFVNSGNKKVNVDLIKLNTNDMIKDIHAIGRLAIEIFSCHLKSKSPVSRRNFRFASTNQENLDMLTKMISEVNQLYDYNDFLQSSDNELQKDFVTKCFMSDKPVSINNIWYHPFINNIESLKVLSVFSILNYFHNKSEFNESVRRKEFRSSSFDDIKKEIESEISESETNDENSKSDEDNDASSSFIEKDSYFKKDGFLAPYRISKPNSNNQFKLCPSMSNADRRKVSLSFLTSMNSINIPQESDAKDYTASSFNSNLQSSYYLDFLIQQKNLIDRRSSLTPYAYNNCLTPHGNSLLANTPTNDQDTLLNQSMEYAVKKFPIETRRLENENCEIKKSEDNSSMIELKLNLIFDDNLCRLVQCSLSIEVLNDFQSNNFDAMNYESLSHISENKDLFDFEKVENICANLTNELIDFGLINPRDFQVISDKILNSIREHAMSNIVKSL